MPTPITKKRSKKKTAPEVVPDVLAEPPPVDVLVTFDAKVDAAEAAQLAELDSILDEIIAGIEAWPEELRKRPRLGDQLNRQLVAVISGAFDDEAMTRLLKFTRAGSSCFSFTTKQLRDRCIDRAALKLLSDLGLEARFAEAEKAAAKAYEDQQQFFDRKAKIEKQVAEEETKFRDAALVAQQHLNRTRRYAEEWERRKAADSATRAGAPPPVEPPARDPADERDVHPVRPVAPMRPRRVKGASSSDFEGANFSSGVTESADFPASDGGAA